MHQLGVEASSALSQTARGQTEYLYSLSNHPQIYWLLYYSVVVWVLLDKTKGEIHNNDENLQINPHKRKLTNLANLNQNKSKANQMDCTLVLQSGEEKSKFPCTDSYYLKKLKNYLFFKNIYWLKCILTDIFLTPENVSNFLLFYLPSQASVC